MNIDEVRKIRLDPGDVVVFRMRMPKDGNVRLSMIRSVEELSRKTFPGHEMVIVDGENDVEVISQGAAFDDLVRAVSRRLAQQVANR
jgi:hypothetical protein